MLRRLGPIVAACLLGGPLWAGATPLWAGAEAIGATEHGTTTSASRTFADSLTPCEQAGIAAEQASGLPPGVASGDRPRRERQMGSRPISHDPMAMGHQRRRQRPMA